METQNEYDDSGLPGPGAPTPLSALEVSQHFPMEIGTMSVAGCVDAICRLSSTDSI